MGEVLFDVVECIVQRCPNLKQLTQSTGNNQGTLIQMKKEEKLKIQGWQEQRAEGEHIQAKSDSQRVIGGELVYVLTD